MSVLGEAFSVIVRLSTISAKYPGGLSAYRRDCPNKTFCADDHLARIGFMASEDVSSFVGHLQMKGLLFIDGQTAHDIAVVDQLKGPTVPCEWLAFERLPDGTSHCWQRDRPKGSLVTPLGWEPRQVHFLEPGNEGIQAKGHSEGLDLFEDSRTGKTMFVGRTHGRRAPPEAKDVLTEAPEGGPWRVGNRLGGRWPIYKIMQGGMGIVYVVHDAQMATLVVAKTFRDEVFQGADGPKIVGRFNAEAKAWIDLGTHPNVVQAYRVLRIGEKPYLFLEYIDGGSLSALISTSQLTRDPGRVVKLALDLCEGMHFARSRGIEAHRDIKPDNCLLTRHGDLKVTDFGLAKVLSGPDESADQATRRHGKPHLLTRMTHWIRNLQLEGRVPGTPLPGRMNLTQTGSAAGTPTHMAPEQFEDVKRADVRADIYALGVVLYQMMSGRLPFEGQSVGEIRRLQLLSRPAPLLSIPRSMWVGIERCLSKDPSHRFAHFGEAASWLREVYREVTGGDEATSRGSSPTPEVDWLSRAYSIANLGLFSEALQSCENAMMANPGDCEAWTLRGSLLMSLNRPEEALESHDKAIEIESDSAGAWHAKGVTLNALKRLDEAGACYERSLELDPRAAQVWYDKGVSLQQLGKVTEAGRCWDRCLRIDSEHSMAWSNRGGVYRRSGEIEKAISCYRRALVVDPKDKISWFNLGCVLANRQLPLEAIECLDTAERLGMDRAAGAKKDLLRKLQVKLT